MPRPGKPFQVYMGERRRAALDALAGSNYRSLHDEILHAIDRHLAQPPVTETPALESTTPEPLPKKRPGRKPGKKKEK